MSTELTVVKNANLPDKMEDLSKFILIGREKLIAVRAEIRAIKKLNLAQEIHKQKQEETVMLAEALLDAEEKLGQLIKEIPKAVNQHKCATDSGVDSKPKKEVVADLGFSEKQAERFETLAENPDIVEFVKAEARENDDIPTRARVLNLAARKKKNNDDYDNYFNLHMKICRELDKIITTINKFEINEYRMDALLENFDGATNISDTIKYIEGAREKLLSIITELRKAEKRTKQA